MNDITILQSDCRVGNAHELKNVLVIFARIPEAGAVKTRLIGARIKGRILSAGDAAKLYEAMLQDTMQLASEFVARVRSFNIILMLDSKSSRAFPLVAMEPIAIWPQSDGDLGARLQHCFHSCRQHGFEKTIAVGSDSPDLPLEYLIHAGEALEKAPLLLGPAQDGGFYLIGMSASTPSVLFEGVEWSKSQVLERVLVNAARLDLKTSLLDTWRDVDDESDLRALIQRLESLQSHAPATRGVLASMQLIEA